MKLSNLLKLGLMAVVLTACGGQDKNSDVLKYGVSPDYPPFEYKDASGKVAGFDIDIMNEICKRMNKTCEPVEGSFDSLIAALNARKFDFINSAMQVTPERAKAIDFSVAQYSIAVQLVAKKGLNLLPTVDSLKGHRVGVQQGSAQETYAKAHWGKQGVEIVSYVEQTLTYSDLKAGRLDAVLVERPNAYDNLLDTEGGDQFEFVGEVITDQLFTDGVAYGFSKGSPLVSEFNKAFLEMVEDGTFEKLMTPYFKNKEDVVFDRRVLDN